jgi:hypothetical protein
MVTPRQLRPRQPGRKCASKLLVDVPDITRPPSHFGEMQRRLWDCTVAFPTFDPTTENYAELTDALEHHIVYCRLAVQIEQMHKNGETPERKLELARDAARRPYTRLLKSLVT